MFILLKEFIKRIIKSDKVYKINKLPMYHLLKANTNLDMR